MSESAASDTTIKSSLLEHLIEMRDRLLKSVIVVGVLFIGLFFYPSAKTIYNWLAAPLINQGHEMIIIGTAAPFLIPMKLTLLVAFLIALPFLFFQLWSFVAPGLYKHEKRLIYPLIASSIFLFYLGIAFVYFILLPMMFQIIPQFAPDISTTYSPDIAEYLNFTIMMFVAFGIGFEMPIATILVISMGMTTAEDLKQKRPYVIVGAFVAGMFLTPPDVVSQIMLAVPMWLLFEVGLIFSTLFNVRIKEAGDAIQEMDESSSTETETASLTNEHPLKKNVLHGEKPVITAKQMWEDENYIYEDELDNLIGEDDLDDEDPVPSNEYQDADSFDMEVSDPKLETELESDEVIEDEATEDEGQTSPPENETTVAEDQDKSEDSEVEDSTDETSDK